MKGRKLPSRTCALFKTRINDNRPEMMLKLETNMVMRDCKLRETVKAQVLKVLYSSLITIVQIRFEVVSWQVMKSERLSCRENNFELTKKSHSCAVCLFKFLVSNVLQIHSVYPRQYRERYQVLLQGSSNNNGITIRNDHCIVPFLCTLRTMPCWTT